MIKAFLEGWSMGAEFVAGGLGVVLPFVIVAGVVYLIVEIILEFTKPKLK